MAVRRSFCVTGTTAHGAVVGVPLSSKRSVLKFEGITVQSALFARRPLASALALLLLVSGLALSPLASAPAEAAASSTSAANILKVVQKIRTDASLPPLLSNGFIKKYANEFTERYAKGLTPYSATKTALPAGYTATASPLNPNYGGGFVSGYGSASARYKTLVNLIKTSDSTRIKGDYNYGATGYYTTGSRAYAVVVLVKYTSTPLDLLTSAAPSISGTPKVGVALTAKTGTYKPAADSYAYAWKVDGATVGSSATFTPRPVDVGKKITLSVAGSKSGYVTTTERSVTTKKAVAKGTIKVSNLTVSGARNVGQTLSLLEPETIIPNGGISASFQWYRSGKKIADATDTSYTLQPGDKGKKVDVQVTIAASGYTTYSKRTATKTATAAPLLNGSSSVTISGNLMVAQTVTANATNGWTPGTTKVAYQWYIAGKAVSKATGKSFLLPGSAAGKPVTVRFTGSAPGYANTSVTSAATGGISWATYAQLGTVKISGTKANGKTVTAVVSGTFSPKPTAYTYQWYKGETPIPKATKKTYTITSSAIAAELRLEVGFERQGYATPYLYDPAYVE